MAAKTDNGLMDRIGTLQMIGSGTEKNAASLREATPPPRRVLFFNTHDRGETETFIEAQRRLLPFHVDYLEGTQPRLNGQPVLSGSRLSRYARKAVCRLIRGRGDGATLTADKAFALWKVLRSSGPDLVLAQYGTSGIGLPPMLRYFGLPLIVHFRGFDATKGEWLRQAAPHYPPMFSYASRVLVVSEQMRGVVNSLGCPEEKIVVNSSGVDVASFGKRDEALVVPDSFVAVGRLVAKKSPLTTIRAFAEVLPEFPTATLEIIGDGPLEKDCRALVAELGISSSVSMRGFQPAGEVRNALARTSIFVQHSVVAPDGDSEGTPNSILEASAAGLPVLATSHGGIPQAVEDGVTGFLVPEHDVLGMAERMKELLREPLRAKEMGEAGRSKMQREFSWESRIATLSAVIDEVLSGR